MSCEAHPTCNQELVQDRIEVDANEKKTHFYYFIFYKKKRTKSNENNFSERHLENFFKNNFGHYTLALEPLQKKTLQTLK